MKREELEHVLRASAAIVNESSFVVIGSQAVLLPHPDAPAELLLSNEVDLYPAVHPEKAELIEPARLLERLRALGTQRYPVERYVAWAQRRAAEASAA